MLRMMSRPFEARLTMRATTTRSVASYLDVLRKAGAPLESQLHIWKSCGEGQSGTSGFKRVVTSRYETDHMKFQQGPMRLLAAPKRLLEHQGSKTANGVKSEHAARWGERFCS